MNPREAAEKADVKASAEADAQASPSRRVKKRDAATPELFAKYQKERDPAIREELILAHMNLVRYLARKFANRGEPLEDLIQVGMIGLINAIDRFDPSRGIRFATYATPTIVGEIRRHFRDRGWAVKVPRRLQELNLAANKAVEALTQKLDRAPTVKELAEELEVGEAEALEAVELGEMYELPSLDTALGGDSDDGRSELADYVGQVDEEIERFERRARLAEAMRTLTARERKIIQLRFFDNLSQTQVAKQLGISQMHVSRLQQRALAKLREAVREQDIE
ncbi:MAG: SigB/SigF/SigG family RNA polymerase sigma factor [Armatimonadetes bacterium]|nr:SigB/SigF/SigG family RNA polymerase sigma factor [Armatimonadota bacterium]